MSRKADEVYDVLLKRYPFFTITREYYVNYAGKKLFFDFFIKELRLLVEVQGEQHYTFNKYFHVDDEGFRSSKQRDNLKKEYCELNNLALVTVDFNERIDEDVLINKFFEALEKLSK